MDLVLSFLKLANRSFNANGDHDDIINSIKEINCSEVIEALELGAQDTASFFVTIYRLLFSSMRNPALIKEIAILLQEICADQDLRNAVVNEYKFLSLITRALQHQKDKSLQLSLLQLLEDSTYKMVISRQDEDLSSLFGTVLRYVDPKCELQLKCAAIGVLIHICSENQTAAYELLQLYDMKTFTKNLYTLETENLEVQIKIFRMLFAVTCYTSHETAYDVHVLMKWIWQAIVHGLNANNNRLLRHADDLLSDIHRKEYLMREKIISANYDSDLETLMKAMKSAPQDSHAGRENIGATLKFIEHLVDDSKFTLQRMYPSIFGLAMYFADSNICVSSAFRLMKVALAKTIKLKNLKSVQGDVFSDCQLLMRDKSIEAVLEFYPLDSTIYRNTRNRNCQVLFEYFGLLQEMIKVDVIFAELEKRLNVEVFERLFEPLIKSDSHEYLKPLHNSVTSFYIQVLSFLSDMVLKNSTWMKLQCDILRQKCVEILLATALNTGNRLLKKEVLSLMCRPSFPDECIDGVTKSMCDLSSSVLPPSELPSHSQSSAIRSPLRIIDNKRVEKLCKSIEETLSTNNSANLCYSAVMELYQHRLETMAQTEKTLLDASSHYQYRHAQLTSQLNKQHAFSLGLQHTIEGLQVENSHWRSKVDEVTNRYAEINKNYSSQESIVKNLNEKISNLTSELEDNKATVSKLQSKMAARDDEYKEMALKKDKELAQKNKEISKHLEAIKDMNKVARSKDEEITDLKAQLAELKHTTEMICKLAGSKR